MIEITLKYLYLLFKFDKLNQRKKNIFPVDIATSREHINFVFFSVPICLFLLSEGLLGVVVYILMRSIATGAYRRLRNSALYASGDRSDLLAILPSIVFLQKAPVLLLKLLDNRKHIGLELLVRRRV